MPRPARAAPGPGPHRQGPARALPQASRIDAKRGGATPGRSAGIR
ncbi:hypothetical protein F504_3878 (plasmid) [Ralstonia pseudosolanacearum FQY_4]|nr:hypothetical protein F504_3878 [Ralstonia pseudosolanacearum FQY_4]